MVPALLVPDCMTIAKAFERSANYCATEESVFAMMTPILVGMRSNSQSFIKMANASEALLSDSSSLVTDNPQGADKPSPLKEALTTVPDTIGSNQGTGPTVINIDLSKQIVDPSFKEASLNKLKECIPCNIKLLTSGDLFKLLIDQLGTVCTQYIVMFQRMLQQLMDLMKFWDSEKYAINLCNLRDWLKQNVCLPDFRRIITALMSMIILMAMEINSLFDLMLQFVIPLVLPFLLALASPLEQFLLLIIQPLQCIIDAITSAILKLDYSAVFNMPIPTLKIGPQGKKQDQPILNSTSTTSPLSSTTTTNTQSWGKEFNINPAQFFSGDIKQQDEDIDIANKELEDLRIKGGSLDMNDTRTREQYSKDLEDARAKVQKANKNRNTTAIQKGAEWQRQVMLGNLRDSFRYLVDMITKVKDAVTQYVNMVMEEIRKFIETFLGGSEKTIIKLFDKLQILQLIKLVTSIIDFLTSKRSCSEEDKITSSIGGLNMNQALSGSGSKVWTDENGVTHIEEDPNVLSDAINSVVEATGQGKSKNVVPRATVIGTGSSPLDETRQKVKSLIELTGDPVLDTTIARAVDSLTSPMKLQFKCPLQTSTVDAEQVNRWMQELNSR